MKVSVITTCYNRHTTVRRAIESVLSQDYANIECIVIDGASKDGSVEEIRAAHVGNRKVNVFVSELDSGIYEAINKGMRLATGDVIALLHSDDEMYDTHTVSHMVSELERTGANFLYADGLFVDADYTSRVKRNWIGGRFARWKVRHGWLPLHPTCYLRREFVQQVGVYDESLRIAADTDFLIRALTHPNARIAYTHRYVVRMRMGGASTSASQRRKMYEEDIRVYARYSQWPRWRKVEKMLWKVPQFITALFRLNY